jgi:hypothetical protein
LEASATLIPKSNNDTMKVQTNFLDEHRWKILIKYFKLNSTAHWKEHIPQWSWFHSMDAKTVQHIQISKCNIAHKQNQGQKSHDHLSGCRKSFWENIKSFHDKSSKEKRNIGTKSQHNEGYILQTNRPHHTKWGNTEIIFSEVRNEPRVIIFPTHIQHSTGIPHQTNKARERNKRNSNREGRSQIIST